MDIIDEFLNAIVSAGFSPPGEIISDGKIHRFASNGNAKDKAGWYVLYTDGTPAGMFGDWRSGTEEKWVSKTGQKMDARQQFALQAKIAASKRERDTQIAADQQQAAETAQDIWSKTKPVEPNHPYLQRKNIADHGARSYQGSLVVPIYVGDEIASLQFILADGTKRFLSSGKTQAGYYGMGGLIERVVCIAEGFSTAATIAECTHIPTVVAFSANNLVAVAKNIRRAHPGAKIILCADDDYLTSGNPGLTKAAEAANAVNGTLVRPIFTAGRPEKATDFNDMAQRHGRDAVAALFNTAEKPRFPVVWIDDAEISINPDYFVKGVIERGSSVLIYGPSGDGKTFFTIDMLCRVAAGQPWRDKRVKQTLVVYVASEAGTSIVRRFVAWRESHLSEARVGITPFAIITRGPNLLLADDITALETEIRAISVKAGMPIGVIAFDTLSRSSPGADENSAKDMSAIVGAGDYLRDSLGAAVLYVHHSGKDSERGARGSSALNAACDTVICVQENIASITKSRDGATGAEYGFDLKVIDLGVDADGDAITTCLITDSAGIKKSFVKKLGRPRTANAINVFEALKTTVTAFGEILPGTSSIPPGTRATTMDRVLTFASVGIPGLNNNRKNEKIIRALDQLKADGIIGLSGNYLWIW